jgi:hypothetical protein
MTKLIHPSSPEYFQQTSNDPYIRHDYKLFYESGKTVIFDNYEDVQLRWFQSRGKFLSHIEVLDHKKSKSITKKGF